MNDKKYNFVIARRWDDERDALCVYAYGSEVHYGTKKDAELMAKGISERSDDTYKPYYIEVK
jgi:hypothetical protein